MEAARRAERAAARDDSLRVVSAGRGLVSAARRTDDRIHPRQQHKALVALPDLRTCGEVAQSLASAAVVTSVAFAPQHVSNALLADRYAVVVVAAGFIDEVVAELLATDADPPAVVVVDESDAFTTAAQMVPVDAALPAAAPVADIVARVLSLLQLTRVPLVPSVVTWGELQLDLRRRQARWRERPIRLTMIQFRIMEVLVLAAGGVVSHHELGRRVWGSESFDDAERVAAHIRRIRKLIEDLPSQPGFLLTVRGEGFRLTDEDLVEGTIELHDFFD